MTQAENKWLAEFKEQISRCKCQGNQPYILLNLREGTMTICDTCKEMKSFLPKSRPGFEQ